MDRIPGRGCAFEHTEFSQRRGDRGEWGGRGRGGPGGDRGERGGREYRSNDDLLEGIFEKAPDAQLLFVGSVNCLRHRPYAGIGKLMQAGRASILSPSMTDFSTGRYLRQVTDAIVELSQERNCKRFILSFGCQWVILSTDGEMIRQELMDEHGIELIFHDDSHLEFGDHQ